MKAIVLVIAFFCISFLACSQVHHSDTLHIYYQLDQSTLASKSKLILDEYMRNILGQKDSIDIRIEGYTDKRGNDHYNLSLSQNRANSIKNYLLKKQVPESYFSSCIGRGKTDISMVMPSRFTDSLCRRVDVIVRYLNKKKVISPAKYIPVLQAKNFVVGKKMSIPNLTFYPGEHKLYEESYEELKNVAKILLENTNIEIQINGHVCCLQKDQKDGFDSESGTWNLSEKRAEVVYKFLVEKGVSPTRLSYKGLGGAQKISPIEQTEADRVLNRRVEIIVSKQ